MPTFDPEVILLGNSDLTQVGETVYAVGNPRGLEGTFSDGIISSIRLLDGDKLIQITAPISRGSSGGPVLNQKGEAIGVSVLSVIDGQNLNFAIPSNYLKSLLTKVGVVKPLSHLTETPMMDPAKQKMIQVITILFGLGILVIWSLLNDGD